MIDKIKYKRKKIDKKLNKTTRELYTNLLSKHPITEDKKQSQGFSLTEIQYVYGLLQQDNCNITVEIENLEQFIIAIFTNDLAYEKLSYDELTDVLKSLFKGTNEERFALYEEILKDDILDTLPSFWFNYQDINMGIYQETIEKRKLRPKETYLSEFHMKNPSLPEFENMPKRMKEVANALTLNELRMFKNKVELSNQGEISDWYLKEFDRKINYIIKVITSETFNGKFFNIKDVYFPSILMNVLMQLRIYHKHGVEYLDEIFDLLNILGCEITYIQKKYHKGEKIKKVKEKKPSKKNKKEIAPKKKKEVKENVSED